VAVSDLFSDAANERLPETAPLALRMRPRRLEEFVGQEQILGEQSALRLAIAEDRVGSSILYGPPGSGKTTLARVIANTTGAEFEELSAVSATVSQVREVIASGLMRPSRMWPIDAVSWSIMLSTWLPSRSVIAGPLPL